VLCSYYIVTAHRRMIWLIVAHIKSHDNIAFHRTMDGESDILEFFVTPAHEQQLVSWFELYKEEGFIFSYQKQENRMLTPQTTG
jgi:hypothetical protein